MAIAHSRITAQGQISVPSNVRQKLGVGPGAVLEWDEEDGRIVVRRATRFTSEEIHSAIFGNTPAVARTDEELKEGIRSYVRKRYARR